MAKLVTVVQTYFQSGNYRNNRIEVEIPDEAAELIRKFWAEKQVGNCVQARYLASNQQAICTLNDSNDNELGGIYYMTAQETQKEEVFEQHFKDKEDEDE